MKHIYQGIYDHIYNNIIIKYLIYIVHCIYIAYKYKYIIRIIYRIRRINYIYIRYMYTRII